MNITFSPIRADWPLTLERDGDAVVVNGERFDFAELPDGALLPRTAVAGDWLAGDVTRENGILHLSVLLPIGPDAAEAARFPEPLQSPADGPIALPEGAITKQEV